MGSSAVRNKVLDTLEPYSLRDQLIVLGNVFVSLGVGVLSEGPHEGLDNPATLLKLIDQPNKGGTFDIGKALVNQGILILGWLESDGDIDGEDE